MLSMKKKYTVKQKIFFFFPNFKIDGNFLFKMW